MAKIYPHSKFFLQVVGWLKILPHLPFHSQFSTNQFGNKLSLFLEQDFKTLTITNRHIGFEYNMWHVI